MTLEWPSKNLVDIETCWSKIAKAVNGADASRAEARRWLVAQYGKPSKQYLFALVHGKEELAEELFQEFGVRMMAGKYVVNADPAGKFRRYLKTCLVNLVREHFRDLNKKPEPLPIDYEKAADEQFDVSWRTDLVQRCYQKMKELEETGDPLFTALDFRKDHPGNNYSDELAALLTAKFGKAVSAGTARKKVLKAREYFCDLLYQAVAETIENPTRAKVIDELAELRLHRYFEKSCGEE